MPIIIGAIAFLMFFVGIMMCIIKPSSGSGEYRSGLIVMGVGFAMSIWFIAATEKYFTIEPQVNGPYPVQEIHYQDGTVTHAVVYEGAIVNLNQAIGKSLKKNDQVIIKRINGIWCYGLYYLQGRDKWELFKPHVLPKDGDEIEFAKGEAYALSNSMGSARKRD
jgi:hypothetical protein